MKLSEIYNQNNNKPVISYEVFPPKGESEEYNTKISALLEELKILKKFMISTFFVSYQI